MNDNEYNFEHINKLKQALEVFDKNKDGFIAIKELKDLMRVLGQDIFEGELQGIIDEVDPDGNGKIDFKEFLGLMSRKMRDYDPEEELIEIFRLFDLDGGGTVSKKEVKNVLGDKISDEEIDEIFKEGMLNEEGLITYEEFVRMVVNK